MSELTRRVLFSVVAIPVVLGAIYAGGPWFSTLLAGIGALGAWELFRMARAGGLDAMDNIGIGLAALFPLAMHARIVGLLAAPEMIVAIVVPAVLGASIWLRGVDGRPLSTTAITILGAVYTGGMLAFGFSLRYHPYAVGRMAGTALVGMPLILTWISDIGAYVAGRTWGKKKLIPSVSPGKTVAGAVGAVIATAAVSALYARFVLPPVAQLSIAIPAAIVFGAALSVVAQVGDLAESLLKREAGVKDSSRLIPGHGGVLDRVDSLLFVLPLAYVMIGPLLSPVMP